MTNERQATSSKPLAARMRPDCLANYYGQQHLLGANKPVRIAIERGLLHSMIFWGPPGTGKTTLARLLAQACRAHFESLSAVLSGVKEIRAVIEQAKARKALPEPVNTILFVDEIHRFNKAQQDAFLPHIEEGVITLIGATTENPSFELNNALLSRVRVYTLKRLSEDELLSLLKHALTDKERGYGTLTIDFPEELQQQLIMTSDGDARLLLNMLETLLDEVVDEHATAIITAENFSAIVQQQFRRFDKQGEYFYDQISALHKSVRGSAPDAALYWFARMIDGGCDPLYLARRVVRMASEDIGNADPRALTLALNAWEVQERLGSPEGELAIAQAIVYLACAAKSNSVYTAYQAALTAAKQQGSLEIPLHLRNAPTKLMQELGYGKQYRYAHDEPYAYAAGENYLPEELIGQQYYFPTDRGLESKIQTKLAFLKELDQKQTQSK